MASSYKGIDVSKWQGTIDWKKVKADGILFAIIRAGYGKNTSNYKDKKFEENYKGAKDAGIKVGVYWYSEAETAADATKEAELCLKRIKGKSLDYPVFFDLEGGALSSGDCINKCKNFCNAIHDANAGYKVGVYSSASVWRGALKDFSLEYRWIKWCAAHTGDINIKPDSVTYDMWQYSSTGSVAGISGNVDMDFDYNVYPTLNSTSTSTSNSSSTSTSSSNSSSSDADSTQTAYDLLNAGNFKAQIHPYMLDCNANTDVTKLSVKKLKKLGVVALNLYVGHYYNPSHTKYEQYMPDNLDGLYKWARKNEFPISCYCITRAKSEAEARSECIHLIPILNAYYPSLGIWIRLDFENKKSVNDKILDVYASFLQEAGFTWLKGIYCTKEQLKTISWDKYKDTFYLHLIDRVKNLSDIPEYLDPTFFKTS